MGDRREKETTGGGEVLTCSIFYCPCQHPTPPPPTQKKTPQRSHYIPPIPPPQAATPHSPGQVFYFFEQIEQSKRETEKK